MKVDFYISSLSSGGAEHVLTNLAANFGEVRKEFFFLLLGGGDVNSRVGGNPPPPLHNPQNASHPRRKRTGRLKEAATGLRSRSQRRRELVGEGLRRRQP